MTSNSSWTWQEIFNGSFHCIPVMHARRQSYRCPWVCRHLPCFPLRSNILLWFAFVLPCSGQAGRSESSSTSAGHSSLLHMATPVIRHYQPFSPVQWAFLPLLSNLMKPNRLQNSRKSLARFHNDLILLCSYKFSFSFKRKKKLRCYFEKRFLLKTTLPKRTIAFHNVLPGKPIIFHS